MEQKRTQQEEPAKTALQQEASAPQEILPMQSAEQDCPPPDGTGNGHLIHRDAAEIPHWTPHQGEKNQQALEAIVKHVPGGVFVYSAEEDEQFSFVSENMLTMLGYTRAEFDRKFDGRFSHMVYAQDRERTLREIWAQIAIGPYDTCFYRIEKKDGSLLWVHDEGHIVTDTNGKRWFYVVIVDITSSVRVQDSLTMQNEELRQTVDSIPVSIVVYRKQAGVVEIAAVNGFLYDWVGESASTLTSLSQQEMIARVAPEDRSWTTAVFHDLFVGRISSAEITYRARISTDVPFQWYRCSARRLQKPDGSVLVYAVYADATGQKIKEENFNLIIQELLTTNPHSLCAFRLNLTQNRCSDGHGTSTYIRHLLNAKTADALLEKISGIITNPEEAARFRRDYSRETLLNAYRKGEDRISVTYHRLTDNGQSHWVTTTFHILQNPYTNDIEAIAYSVDSDHTRKEAEIIAAITGEEYEKIGLVETATEKVSYYYLSEQALLPKERMPHLYGDYIALLSKQIASPAEREQYLRALSLAQVQAALAEKPAYRYAYSCLGEDGKRYRKQLNFRYLERDHTEIMFTRTDVTAAFEHEEAYLEQLRQALLQAERANEMKSDFLGNVSHDMRTPLNAILGYNTLALQAETAAEKDAYLHKISIAGNTLLSLINDTLDLQKIENGSTELKLTPLPCSDVLQDIIASVRPLMENKHISFVIDNSRAVMATVAVDIIKIREVFINLLSNAAKFTPEGGLVEMRIECLQLDPDTVHDRITIRDTGIGISREFQEKMFEPFAQERTKETSHIGGSGLGLTIVKRLLDLMGGRIAITSTLGQGTTCTVYLDLPRVDCRQLPEKEQEAELGGIAGLHVLLCEDNEMNQEIARRILTLNGAEVVTASDGAEGLQLFSSSRPGTFDIVLMDIRMPNMDGYTAAQKMRTADHPQAKTIPILAMSADAYASDIEKAMNSGMNGHVAKPIDPRKLIAEMSHLTQETSDTLSDETAPPAPRPGEKENVF